MGEKDGGELEMTQGLIVALYEKAVEEGFADEDLPDAEQEALDYSVG